MRWRVCKQVALTTFREHLRTPEALFWTYAFPLILMVVLGLAFGHKPPAPVRVVVPAGETAAALAEAVRGPGIDVVVLDEAAARQRLARGEADLLLEGAPRQPVLEYDVNWPDTERAVRLVEDALQRHAGRKDPLEIRHVELRQPGKRYLDWLLPGLLGMQLLGAGMWGVGFNLVDMRIKNLLRRLVVTPMRRSEFLASFMLSRVGLMMLEAAITVGIGMAVFGVPFLGSVAQMVLIVLLGSLTFCGLGVLVASRVRTHEAVSGLMNLVLLPMWLLGGIFFSAGRFPDFVQPLVQALPITHLNEAMRMTMLEGRGLAEVAPHLGLLAAFTIVFFVSALKLFRWS